MKTTLIYALFIIFFCELAFGTVQFIEREPTISKSEAEKIKRVADISKEEYLKTFWLYSVELEGESIGWLKIKRTAYSMNPLVYSASLFLRSDAVKSEDDFWRIISSSAAFIHSQIGYRKFKIYFGLYSCPGLAERCIVYMKKNVSQEKTINKTSEIQKILSSIFRESQAYNRYMKELMQHENLRVSIGLSEIAFSHRKDGKITIWRPECALRFDDENF